MNVALQNKAKKILYLGIFLFILSVLVYLTEHYPSYRGMRAITCFSFFGYLFYSQKSIKWPIIAFLSFYGFSSLLTVWYEVPVSATASLALNNLSFLILIGALLPKISLKKMGTFITLSLLLLILINGYLLFEFTIAIQQYALGKTHNLFIILSSILLLTLAFLALAYNHKISSQGSLFFLIFVVSLIFAEVFRAIAYYGFDENFSIVSVYIARGLLIVSLGSLSYFSIIKEESKVLFESMKKERNWSLK